MNKKVLGFLAASAAVVGSAIFAAPARAQSADLDVEVQITPAIFLRTYSALKFTVNAQDLRGGSSVDQLAGIYDETIMNPLSTDLPPSTGDGTITKEVPVLYQVWGTGVTDDDITIAATTPELTTGTSGGAFEGDPATATMTATKGALTQKTASNGTSQYQEGSATIGFDFGSSTPASGTYTGGIVTITVANP